MGWGASVHFMHTPAPSSPSSRHLLLLLHSPRLYLWISPCLSQRLLNLLCSRPPASWLSIANKQHFQGNKPIKRNEKQPKAHDSHASDSIWGMRGGTWVWASLELDRKIEMSYNQEGPTTAMGSRMLSCTLQSILMAFMQYTGQHALPGTRVLCSLYHA
ncbi:hypothetical protein BC939DRAFT_444381 [Gamsiella multidivaricata]|uniref:uncharacterized protein n=1 Tax=Gamsiella multidivaricata TaxID=101098 RepID=UPI00222078FF|nr:uncharacterized protein BC939DRAFT_444381 [Gamsiella multidivaricata]KAI7828045.1 hypothetical protein BC939DRAFT_444381 [Gamsiella multidivaricata]